ncbi:MAG: BspA family leucine-rich repeat surface protein [Bacteroidales bacterium]|nr:BspA family leucine-rich repeat surface protein [Bacteroidales bacterium]
MFIGRYNYDTYDYESSIERIDFGEGFNTANVTDMGEMFFECNSLTSLNLSNFNTENVTNMHGMFRYCNSLTTLDLSNFNTENVTDMRYMFTYCSSLSSLNLSSFNTENVTTMREMFSNCGNLTRLNLSNFNTENVTDMSYMFWECYSLTSLDLSNFDMSHLGYYYDNDPNNWETGKEGMCSNLSYISGYCTITCPAAVQSELENGTSLPTSEVTFTWLRPTSK